MKVLCVVLVTVMMACVVSGELLAMLQKLETSDVFHDMSQHDQILLIDIIAATETCKLTELAQMIGRDTIVTVISHLPSAEESQIQDYLTQHKEAEANGTCTIQ